MGTRVQANIEGAAAVLWRISRRAARLQFAAATPDEAATGACLEQHCRLSVYDYARYMCKY